MGRGLVQARMAPVSPALLYGLLAGVPAIVAEWLYKVWEGPWWTGLWLWVPLQLTIGYSIYRLVNIPGISILEAFVVFAACTAAFRIVLSVLILHQEVSTGAWIAFGLIVLANLVRTFWRTS